MGGAILKKIFDRSIGGAKNEILTSERGYKLFSYTLFQKNFLVDAESFPTLGNDTKIFNYSPIKEHQYSRNQNRSDRSNKVID